MAAGSKAIGNQLPQIPGALQPVYVAGHEVPGRIFRFQTAHQPIVLRKNLCIDNPHIQASIVTPGPGHRLALVAMELQQVRRIKLDVRAEPDHNHRFSTKTFGFFPRFLPHVVCGKEANLLVSDHRRGEGAAGNHSHRINAPTQQLFNSPAQHRPA